MLGNIFQVWEEMWEVFLEKIQIINSYANLRGVSCRLVTHDSGVSRRLVTQDRGVSRRPVTHDGKVSSRLVTQDGGVSCSLVPQNGEFPAEWLQ